MPKGVYKRKPFSGETRRRMSRVRNEEWARGKRKVSPKWTFKGKHHTREAKEKIRQAHLGVEQLEETKKRISQQMKGEKHWNWKGGISKNLNYLSWIKNKRNRLKGRACGSHIFGEWELLKKQYDYTCPCCKRQEPQIKLTEDHIIPLSKGGSDYIENIQPLCKSCNSKKYNKIINFNND